MEGVFVMLRPRISEGEMLVGVILKQVSSTGSISEGNGEDILASYFIGLNDLKDLKYLELLSR